MVDLLAHVIRSWWCQLRGALAELGGVVLPVECGGCGSEGPAACPACTAGLGGPARPVPASPGLPAWAVAQYAGPVRQLVVAWKDRGRLDLTGPLARALEQAVVAVLDDVLAGADQRPPGPRSGARSPRSDSPVLLVPVPSSRAAGRRRGADVVLRLARRAAGGVRARGTPVRVVPALRLGRSVADQAGLTRAGRARNMAGAMCLRIAAGPAVRGRACVVVDDIVTTGASAREAARVLVAAGAVPLGVAAVCATPLHRRLSDAAHLH